MLDRIVLWVPLPQVEEFHELARQYALDSGRGSSNRAAVLALDRVASAVLRTESILVRDWRSMIAAQLNGVLQDAVARVLSEIRKRLLDPYWNEEVHGRPRIPRKPGGQYRWYE